MTKSFRVLLTSLLMLAGTLMVSLFNTPTQKAEAGASTAELQLTQVAIQRTQQAISSAQANGPIWNGPAPGDTLVRVADQSFDASSTPVRIATPVSTVGTLDVFMSVENIGSAGGTGTIYLDGTSTSFSVAPGMGAKSKLGFIGLTSNAPVSIGGDATAGVSIRCRNIILRRRNLP